MNLNTDWNMVQGRPQIDIPAELEKPMIKSFEGTNHFIEKCWRGIWLPNLNGNKNIVGDFSKYGYYNICGTKYGRTAYLVGGGPSLKHNLCDLKRNDKTDVFCDAHTFKYLIDNGVRPDYTVVLDGKDVQAEWLDIGQKSDGMTLLMDIHCSPKIFGVWKGPIIFFRSTAQGEDSFTKEQYAITDFDHIVLSGGNVITSAYYMVVKMGYSKVVFVGNDLSNDVQDWNPNYADGSRDDGLRDRIERIVNGADYDASWIPFQDYSIECDIQGKGVCSLGRMFHYKYWLDWQSQMNTSVEHINATEAGILGAYPEGNIKSMKQMRLRDVEV